MASLILGNVKGPQGPQGLQGEQGFSPEITENSGNTPDVYRLDIVTKDKSFTTPNLKGERGEPGEGLDEVLGGLTFAQNAKGEWGYIPPGADSVIPFSNGSSGGGTSGGGNFMEAVAMGYFDLIYDGWVMILERQDAEDVEIPRSVATGWEAA